MLRCNTSKIDHTVKKNTRAEQIEFDRLQDNLSTPTQEWQHHMNSIRNNQKLNVVVANKLTETAGSNIF
jgi:hypothetical protein